MNRLRHISILLAMVLLVCAPGISAQGDEAFAILAKNGSKVSAAAAKAGNAGFLLKADVETLYLQDGSLLLTADYMRWSVEKAANDSFALSCNGYGGLCVGGKDGETYMTDIKSGNKGAQFFVNDSCIATCWGGKILYLVFSRQNYFCFIEKQTYNSYKYAKSFLQAMPPQGETMVDEWGVKTFDGHFVAKQIAAAIDSTTTAVDLTKAVLPLKLSDFNYAAPTNCLVYMRSDAAELAPRTWQNVVAVNQDGAHLIRQATLVDQCQFYAPLPFTVGEDSLHYVRFVPQEGWNTLVLPFTAGDIPEAISAFRATEIENDEIELEPCSEIKAGIPYLMRKELGAEGNTAVTFTAAGGSEVISATPEWTSGALCGTFRKLSPAKSDASYMFLSPDGFTFSLAADGSYLSPFRCGFMFDQVAHTRALSLPGNGVVAAESAKVCNAKPQKIYDIQGRTISAPQNMPKGVYIINGKKKYVK